MWVLRESVDELVVGKISGQVSLGLYTMAKELALMPNHKIANVINMLSSPVMAELQGNIDAMRTALYRAVRLSAAIVVPMSAGIALVADEMVPALLGPKWAPATRFCVCLVSMPWFVRSMPCCRPCCSRGIVKGFYFGTPLCSWRRSCLRWSWGRCGTGQPAS